MDEAQDTNPEQWQVVAALAQDFFAGLGAPRRTAHGLRGRRTSSSRSSASSAPIRRNSWRCSAISANA
ncbi:MAG: hypothetical protein WDN69_04865 [Aliidongia sp.]